jgi:UDP-N-acetylmuramate--alanine ligase
MEAFVSTLRRPCGGHPAPSLLAELVGLADSIVVAGAHGKTTTTAMIAFALDRLGRDPSFLIGGEVPQSAAMPGPGAAGSSSRETSRTEAFSHFPRLSLS